MRINEDTYEITVAQNDYGIPIPFEAGTEQGFSIDNEIVFVFNTDAIPDKLFTVSTEDFTFNLALTKEEADSLFDYRINTRSSIEYSVKRYSAGQFLETLVDSTLTVMHTLKWDGDNNG